MANRIDERSFKPTGSVDTELLIQQIVWACSEHSDNNADVGKKPARCNRTRETLRRGLGRAPSLVPQPAANALWLAHSENRPKVASGKQALPQALKGQPPRTVFQPVDGTDTAALTGAISALFAARDSHNSFIDAGRASRRPRTLCNFCGASGFGPWRLSRGHV